MNLMSNPTELRNRLTTEDQQEVVKLFASYHDISEIIETLREKRGVSTTWDNIHNMCHQVEKWRLPIERARQIFEQGIMKEPMYSKRSRLRKLEISWQHAHEKGNDRDAIDAVEVATKILDPRIGSTVAVNLTQLNLMSDDELLAFKMQHEEKL